jgi:hypothetical protein
VFLNVKSNDPVIVVCANETLEKAKELIKALVANSFLFILFPYFC